MYAVSPITDRRGQHCHGQDNMVPLAQIYSPGSHVYEAATLMRPPPNQVPCSSSMMHWGNVPSSLLKAVNSQPTSKPIGSFDPSHHHPSIIAGHHTLVHPLHYVPQNGGHNCPKKSKQHKMVDLNNLALRGQQPLPLHQYPSNLPLPLHSSTLMPGKLAKSMYDVTKSPEDITPTNSIPIDSFYKVSPHFDGNLIATTCLSTLPSVSNQNEYSTTADALNHPQSSHLNFNHPHYQNPDEAPTGVSDTSSSSHPSSGGTDGLMVTESSSLDSSGTTSSTVPPLSNPLSSQRKDLPPLPSRVDRYRIYSHGHNDSNASYRSQTARRPCNNNYANSDTKSSEKKNHQKNFKSFDDLQAIGGAADSTRHPPAPADQDTANNVANNNYNDNPLLAEARQQNAQEEYNLRPRNNNNSAALMVPLNGRHFEEDSEESDLYDHCNETWL